MLLALHHFWQRSRFVCHQHRRLLTELFMLNYKILCNISSTLYRIVECFKLQLQLYQAHNLCTCLYYGIFFVAFNIRGSIYAISFEVIVWKMLGPNCKAEWAGWWYFRRYCERFTNASEKKSYIKLKEKCTCAYNLSKFPISSKKQSWLTIKANIIFNFDAPNASLFLIER